MENKNNNIDAIQKITNIKKLEKEYFIGNVIGDGNCLFYSLRNLIFGKINFYQIIRLFVIIWKKKVNLKISYKIKTSIYQKWEMIKFMELGMKFTFFSIMYGIQIKYFLRTILL